MVNQNTPSDVFIRHIVVHGIVFVRVCVDVCLCVDSDDVFTMFTAFMDEKLSHNS